MGYHVRISMQMRAYQIRLGKLSEKKTSRRGMLNEREGETDEFLWGHGTLFERDARSGDGSGRLVLPEAIKS